MKVVALISGGKDSCFNMMQCVSNGHEIIGLANLYPPDGHTTDEMDSFMFQTVGHGAISAYAECMGLPLFRAQLRRNSHVQQLDYVVDTLDEVEDLYELLIKVKTELPSVEAVSVGAILSDYQRIRVENVCSRLGLVSLSYLWRQPQRLLLEKMIDSGIEAILIKVAAMGLEPKKHLGKTIKEMKPTLFKLNDQFDVHPCGEGGEYETYTLDCPIFKKRIVIDEKEMHIHSDSPIASVGFLKIVKFHFEDKNEDPENVKSILESLRFSFEDYITAYESDFPSIDSISIVPTSISSKGKHLNAYDERKSFINKRGNFFWVSARKSTKDTPSEQVQDIQASIESLTKENGFDLEHLCLAHLSLCDMKMFEEINNAYKKGVKHLNPPSRVCVELPLQPQEFVSLDFVGFKGNKSVMHVQGRSYWAPSNIGPYSQSSKVDKLALLAGQIALIPSSLTMITGNDERETLYKELCLSLRNKLCVIEAIDLSISGILSVVCYVSKSEYIQPAKEFWSFFATQKGISNVPIVVISTSSLPRKSSVEWHFFTSSDKSEVTKLQTETHKTIHVASSFGAGTFSLVLCFPHTNTSKVFIIELTDLIRDKLSAKEFGLKDTLIARLFHPPLFEKEDEAKTFVDDFLSSFHESDIEVQFVPTAGSYQNMLQLQLVGVTND